MSRYPDITLDEAREALSFVSPELPREDWISVAYALQSEFGGVAWELFDAWSQGGSTYDPADARSAWRSLKSDRGVGIAPLLKRAKEGGWRQRQRTPEQAEQTKKEAEARRARMRAEEQAKQARERRVQEAVAALSHELISNHLQTTGRSPYLENKQVRAHGLYFARRSVLVVMDKASAGWQIHTSRADVDAFFTAHRQYQGADPEQVPYSFRYIKPGTLAVPFRDIDRKLWSVQLIFPSGTKSFFRGSRKQATFHLLGTAPRASKRRKTVWMAEGYATAATVHELTQCPTVMAIDAGNLLPVAKAVRKLWPAVDIAFAADNDADKPGNPGVTAATAAAQAVGGYVVVPKIGE